MVFCGIDLHSNNSFVVVSDENDKVLFSRRLPNDLRQICDALSPYRAQLSGVVVESTYNWYWLVDGLMEAGHTVHLAKERGSGLAKPYARTIDRCCCQGAGVRSCKTICAHN